jgi:molybdopterin converting factor small subunit
MPSEERKTEMIREYLARQREEKKQQDIDRIDALRADFKKQIDQLRTENESLREQRVVVQEKQGGGFIAFAVGCAIGLLIGG